MSDVIVRAENLGKRYLLKHQAPAGYRKFSDALVHAATAPLRWMNSTGREGGKDKTQEDFWALKEVSFEIRRGEVVGIIGRNGAGKSTLLKILSRITEPTTGRITLGGRVASLLEVGTGFHPELTGRENIYLNGAILGMSKDEIKAKFDEIVAFAEVEKFLDTAVKHYSSGMYVRLAFAVAAHLEPEILVVDEVLAVGDAEFQNKCLGKMQDVANGGRTVLFVSHQMPAVQRLCTSGMVLDAGRVVARGGIDECIAAYLQGSDRHARFSADLSTRPQTDAGSFKYLSISIKDSNGQPLQHLRVGQECEVELKFECVRAHRELVIGLAVRTPDGFPLFATHNNDFGRTAALEKGVYTVRMQLRPNFLRHGRYSISVGAISSGVPVSHIERALLLEVDAVASDRDRVVDDRIGALFIPMEWGTPVGIS